MRAPAVFGTSLFVSAGLLVGLLGSSVAACSSSSSSSGEIPEADSGLTTPDGSSSVDGGGGGDASPTTDGGDGGVGPLPVSTEVEPNNGNPATQVGTMTIPGQMNGAIDPANDIDIFKVSPMPGEFWEWTLSPTGASLAPHLAIFDTAQDSLNPPAVVAGTAGAPLVVQNFVLRPGSFVAAVRDARNVPTPSGIGGPAFGYALVASKKTPNPTTVTFPSTKTGTLASLGAVHLFTFTGTGGKGWDIVVKAARKTAPSTLDSRLSLYDITGKKAVITNDDAPGTSDSQIGSDDAAPSTYMVVLENEGTNATDLSYEIEFTLRP